MAEQETQRFSFLGGSLCHWTLQVPGAPAVQVLLSMPGACSSPASCLSDIYGTRFSAQLAWHRFFNSVTGDKLNRSHPCTVSSSHTAVYLSRNYTSLKQRWAQAVVLLICTEGLLHCAPLVVLRANPRSGMTTVLKKLHVPLVPRLSLWTKQCCCNSKQQSSLFGSSVTLALSGTCV